MILTKSIPFVVEDRFFTVEVPFTVRNLTVKELIVDLSTDVIGFFTSNLVGNNGLGCINTSSTLFHGTPDLKHQFIGGIQVSGNYSIVLRHVDNDVSTATGSGVITIEFES